MKQAALSDLLRRFSERSAGSSVSNSDTKRRAESVISSTDSARDSAKIAVAVLQLFIVHIDSLP
jgi:hypothetical protein